MAAFVGPSIAGILFDHVGFRYSTLFVITTNALLVLTHLRYIIAMISDILQSIPVCCRLFWWYSFFVVSDGYRQEFLPFPNNTKQPTTALWLVKITQLAKRETIQKQIETKWCLV